MAPNDGSVKARRNSSRIWRKVAIAAMLAILICGVWFVVRSRETRQPLPDAADVRSMEAKFYHREKQENVSFQVPRGQWNAIFSALRPARRDDSPKKWAGLGRLNLKLVNGDSFVISMYRLNHPTGAFSAGPTIESRKYYRGGNSSDLEKAMVDAFDASEGNK